MKQNFEDLIVKADYSKESGLYEKLGKKLFSERSADLLAGRRIQDKDLEYLAAAGDMSEIRSRHNRVFLDLETSASNMNENGSLT